MLHKSQRAGQGVAWGSEPSRPGMFMQIQSDILSTEKNFLQDNKTPKLTICVCYVFKVLLVLEYKHRGCSLCFFVSVNSLKKKIAGFLFSLTKTFFPLLEFQVTINEYVREMQISNYNRRCCFLCVEWLPWRKGMSITIILVPQRRPFT